MFRSILAVLIALTAAAAYAGEIEIVPESQSSFIVTVNGSSVTETTETGQTQVQAFYSLSDAQEMAKALYVADPSRQVRIIMGSTWTLTGGDGASGNTSGGSGGTGGTTTGTNTGTNTGSGGTNNTGGSGGSGGSLTDPNQGGGGSTDTNTNPQPPLPEYDSSNQPIISSFNINAALNGAQMVYVSPTGTGDGSSPSKPLGPDPDTWPSSGHVAIRLLPGKYRLASALGRIRWKTGQSWDKPYIICPSDLGNPRVVILQSAGAIADGVALTECQKVIVYGIEADGRISIKDPDGNTVTTTGNNGLAVYGTNTRNNDVRFIACRAHHWRQGYSATFTGNSIQPNSSELIDSVLERCHHQGIWAKRGDLTLRNVVIFQCGLAENRREHAAYLCDLDYLMMDGVAMIQSKGAGVKVQTLDRNTDPKRPNVIRRCFIWDNGNVGFAVNVNGDPDDPWRGVKNLVVEDNIQSGPGSRMFDFHANQNVIYRRNVRVNSTASAAMFNLNPVNTEGFNVTLATKDVLIEDNACINGPWAFIEYSDMVRQGLTKPYEKITIRGNVVTQLPGWTGNPQRAVVMPSNTSIAQKGIVFDPSRPNIYAIPHLKTEGFKQGNVTRDEAWYKSVSNEPYATTGVPAWPDATRDPMRYLKEVAKLAATETALIESLKSGKVKPTVMADWILTGTDLPN